MLLRSLLPTFLLLGSLPASLGLDRVPRPHNNTLEKRDTVITSCSVKNSFAMTFDDGPLYGGKIATYLNGLKTTPASKAPFFVNGNNWRCIYDYPYAEDLIARYKAGHQIAAHTWTHPDITTITSARFEQELDLLETALWKILLIASDGPGRNFAWDRALNPPCKSRGRPRRWGVIDQPECIPLALQRHFLSRPAATRSWLPPLLFLSLHRDSQLGMGVCRQHSCNPYIPHVSHNKKPRPPSVKLLTDVGMPPSPLPPPAPAAAPNLPAIAPAPAPAAADADADALEPAPPPPALPQLQVNPEAQDEVDYASGSGGVGLESGARGGGGAAAARDASDDDDDGNKSGEEGQERSEEGLKEKARGRPGRLPGRVIGPRNMKRRLIPFSTSRMRQQEPKPTATS